MSETTATNEDILVECDETSPVLRTLTIEVSAPRVARAFEAAYAELKKTARVRGFRPGRVPRNVLEQMYGAQLPDEIERTLVSETLAVAIEKAEVTPISEPDVEAQRPSSKDSFRYTVRVEVKPEIVLPDLSEVVGRRPAVHLADNEIEAEVEKMREGQVQWIEEDEGTEAANEHSLVLDFSGRIDGEVFQGGTAEGVELLLGSGTMVPGFEDQLIGVRAGEERQIEVTFPEDYGSEEMNGKEATFDCKISAVRRRELPELDDEFAKDVGEFETMEALRSQIRSDLEEQRNSQADEALDRSLMESLLGLCDFEVPPGVVDRQLQSQMQSLYQQFKGRMPDEMIQQQLQRMQEDGRPVAERRVREILVLEAVALAREIEVASEEVDARIEEMAEQQGMEVAQVRQMAEQQGWFSAIEAELRDKKVYSVLSESADIQEVDADAPEGEAPVEA
ncbi:MAG: trigger factor [Deltaproteobacteria bacterium]|nr:trigger factor [Deltaproteobacteria bacterium]